MSLSHERLVALEAVLLSRSEPIKTSELAAVFQEEFGNAHEVRRALLALQQQWAARGLNLIETALGWQFQTRPTVAKYLRPLAGMSRTQRFSRAAIETLAIIAYKQPVSRGDIEDIRGVAVSASILKSLEDQGWIKEVGHRNVMGRPALFGTTPGFLVDFGLTSLSELPQVP
jgi:segregation and condensation protein B